MTEKPYTPTEHERESAEAREALWQALALAALEEYRTHHPCSALEEKYGALAAELRDRVEGKA